MTITLLAILFSVSAFVLGMQISVVISFLAAILIIYYLHYVIKKLQVRVVYLERALNKLKEQLNRRY